MPSTKNITFILFHSFFFPSLLSFFIHFLLSIPIFSINFLFFLLFYLAVPFLYTKPFSNNSLSLFPSSLPSFSFILAILQILSVTDLTAMIIILPYTLFPLLVIISSYFRFALFTGLCLSILIDRDYRVKFTCLNYSLIARLNYLSQLVLSTSHIS